MNRIFRSLIDVKKTISQEDLCKNYFAFKNSSLNEEGGDFTKLFTLLEAHYRQYHEMPSIELLFAKGTNTGDESLLLTLQEIIKEIPLISSSYVEAIAEHEHTQAKEILHKTLQTTWTIAESGYKAHEKGPVIKGLEAARNYFLTQTTTLVPSTSKGLNTANPKDLTKLKDEYEKRKTYGFKTMYSFLPRIDRATKGFRPGELIILAAAIKQGKTITATNIAYSGILQGLSGLYITLEMSHTEMQQILYLIHSQLDQFKEASSTYSIDFDNLRDGNLSKEAEDFFFNSIAPDLLKEDYGRLYIEQPTSDMTPSKIFALCDQYDAQLKAEGRQLDFLVVDYIGLLAEDRVVGQLSDRRSDLNSIIRKLKSLALTFDSGRGLIVLSPYQINREGMRATSKASVEGEYEIFHLSECSEIERSADLILTSYMSKELKAAGLLRLGCLLHRRGPGFDSYDVKIDFKHRYIEECLQMTTTNNENLGTMDSISFDLGAL